VDANGGWALRMQLPRGHRVEQHTRTAQDWSLPLSMDSMCFT